MSLFRKPKKIQRRVFCGDDDDEEADGDPQPPPPPIISKEKKENKPAKVKTKALLSFADEEEDGEVFKVKKSKQSSRLIKKREKEKKQIPENNSNKVDINYVEDNSNNIHQEEKPRKKVTLEGLILSGREALAADGAGDLSDEAVEEEKEDDDRGFHRYRPESVRAALAPGVIPDAALIHAARKTRQQARELGDFVPVNQTSETPGSRLIRDDDGSGDDDDEGRIQVRGLELPSDKPKRGTAAAPTNEELDSEPDEWEEQQIKKAMPALADITSSIAMNPFSLAPPPPPPHPYYRPLVPTPGNAEELVLALSTRLEELKSERDKFASKRMEVLERLSMAQSTKTSCLSKRVDLASSYRRAQAMRGYLTDLVECLDEKMPELEALEARALALHKRRCDFLMERRRADVRDQAQDVLALAGRSTANKGPEDEAKIRRTAEREGRRRARRLARAGGPAGGPAGGLAGGLHREGDSSDDDLPPQEHHHLLQQRESIRSAAASLFADALPAWRSLRGVVARLARWRKRDRAMYVDTYLPACLPKLLAPYVRQQLILWNPLADEDNEDYEKMEWYKCLMMYGVTSERPSSDSSSSGDAEEDPPRMTEQSLRDDPDLMLVPNILAKVVLPKIVELIESCWDPMCVRACNRLRGLVPRVLLDGSPRRPPALAALGAALDARLQLAAPDVFLPCLPPQVIEGAGGSFWRRCLGASVRLLRGALALAAPPRLLRPRAHVRALLDTVCLAAGAAPPVLMCVAATALAESLPRTGELRASALARIAALAKLALSKLQSDNPLHLKALEQARTIIAEAKALE